MKYKNLEEMVEIWQKVMGREPDVRLGLMGSEHGTSLWRYTDPNESEVMVGAVKDSLPGLIWRHELLPIPTLKLWTAHFKLNNPDNKEESVEAHLGIMCGTEDGTSYGVMIRLSIH